MHRYDLRLATNNNWCLFNTQLSSQKLKKIPFNIYSLYLKSRCLYLQRRILSTARVDGFIPLRFHYQPFIAEIQARQKKRKKTKASHWNVSCSSRWYLVSSSQSYDRSPRLCKQRWWHNANSFCVSEAFQNMRTMRPHDEHTSQE